MRLEEAQLDIVDMAHTVLGHMEALNPEEKGFGFDGMHDIA